MSGQGTFAAEIRQLTLCYGEEGTPLFSGLDLQVQQGETLALYGPSGCGKSTILRLICGVIPRNIRAEVSGEVLLWGKPVAEHSRAELAEAVGVVFQNPETQLFCDTVEDELAFGLENLCLPREEMTQRIDDALGLTGLEHYRTTSPALLSGGQKQLVVLAAVMAMRPRLLLLDEAMSQLDAAASAEMMAVFRRLQANGQTILMVDHDQDNLALAHRTVDLGEWQGRG